MMTNVWTPLEPFKGYEKNQLLSLKFFLIFNPNNFSQT